MAGKVGLAGRSFAQYLRDLIDEDWKTAGSNMGKDATETEKAEANAVKRVPNQIPWQWRRGEDAFYEGKAIRACGYDVTMSDSRRLWRLGWVAACRRHIAARGGRFRGNASR